MPVYLIHFDKPYHHAQHYLGYADDVKKRIARHRRGNGAKLLKVLKDNGIKWKVVRIWDGDRSLERRLKNWHNASRLCPVCIAERSKNVTRKDC